MAKTVPIEAKAEVALIEYISTTCFAISTGRYKILALDGMLTNKITFRRKERPRIRSFADTDTNIRIKIISTSIRTVMDAKNL